MPRPRKQARPADNPITVGAAIADQVRRLRQRRDWSQRQLAEALTAADYPTTTGSVQALEWGDTKIPLETLLALAYVLDVAPVELLSGSFLENRETVPLFGSTHVRPEQARAWISGDEPLAGQDPRRYDEQVGDDMYLVRKRLDGLAELRRLLVAELHPDALRGDEDRIDDDLRALEQQVRYVRRMFGRHRGTGRLGARGSGTVEVERGSVANL